MTAKRPAIRTSDLALAVALAALCPPAWLVPERRWPALAEKIVAAGWQHDPIGIGGPNHATAFTNLQREGSLDRQPA